MVIGVGAAGGDGPGMRRVAGAPVDRPAARGRHADDEVLDLLRGGDRPDRRDRDRVPLVGQLAGREGQVVGLEDAD